MQKKWTKETVFEESKKYSSRSEFKKKKSGAFRIAYMNGWLDEMMSLSVAYSKVQSHVTREMERKADELLDKWLPEYTNYEMVE